jgi:hypothetical protein
LPGKLVEFSDEHRREILDLMKSCNYAPTDNEMQDLLFLSLEHHCSRFLWLQNAKNHSRDEHRDLVVDAVKDIKAAIGSLKRIQKDWVPLRNLRELDENMTNYFADSEAQARIMNHAKSAREHLESLLPELERYKEPVQKGGKSTATTVLFTEIAKILPPTLGDVRLTKYKGGFFFSLCELLLNIVDPLDDDQKMRDLSRSCSKAIDAVNKNSE